jgi:hypothetical protein
MVAGVAGGPATVRQWWRAARQSVIAAPVRHVPAPVVLSSVHRLERANARPDGYGAANDVLPVGDPQPVRRLLHDGDSELRSLDGLRDLPGSPDIRDPPCAQHR